MANIPLAGQSDAYKKAGALLFGLDPTQLQQAKELGYDFSKTSLLESALAGRLLNLDDTMRRQLDEQSERRLREAKAAQELGKESLAETAKYQMLFDIPRYISQSFSNQAMLNVLGARNAAEAMSTTLASYPRSQFASYPFQPQKYFS